MAALAHLAAASVTVPELSSRSVDIGQTTCFNSSSVGSAAGWAANPATLKSARCSIAPLQSRTRGRFMGAPALAASSSVFLGSDFSYIVQLEQPLACASVASFTSARAFSKEKQQTVIDSWSILKKDAANVAVKFFIKIFEIAPSAKKLFSFLKDSNVPLEKNPKLRTHALIVLKRTADAASQLGEKGALDALRPVLLELGKSHVAQGVYDEHFDVVKYALLKTIEEELAGQDNSKVVSAWSEAYDELVDIIRAEMHHIRDSQVPASV